MGGGALIGNGIMIGLFDLVLHKIFAGFKSKRSNGWDEDKDLPRIDV
jgi:hypothetical protein